jgi:hypothetical protein
VAVAHRSVWPWLVALAAFVVYLAAGLTLISRGYAIGDAVARMQMARAVVDSRDTHAAAVGLVWMPLPVLLQLPGMLVLTQFGATLVSGPLSTALLGAATVPVIARLGTCIGLRRGLLVAVVLLYAFNPVTIFYAANGMSEASFLLLAAIACLAYLRWLDTGYVRYMGLLGIALAFACLTRYEAALMAGVFAVAVALQTARGRRFAAFVVVILPSVFAWFVWLALCQVLLGDAFFGPRWLSKQSVPPTDARWLPHDLNLSSVGNYCLDLTLRYAPLLLLVVPLALGSELPRFRLGARRLGAVVVLLAAAVFPGEVGILLMRRDSWGDPRYFSELALFVAIAAIWLLRPASSLARPTIAALVLAGLALGWATGFATMSDPAVAAVEGEPVAMKTLLGQPPDNDNGSLTYVLPQWEDFVKRMDSRVRPGDLVAVDATQQFAIPLLTRHPTQVAIPSDRDFEQLLDTGSRRINFVVLDTSSGASMYKPVLQSILRFPPQGKSWVKVEESPGAALYALQEGPDTSAGPTAQPTNGATPGLSP